MTQQPSGSPSRRDLVKTGAGIGAGLLIGVSLTLAATVFFSKQPAPAGDAIAGGEANPVPAQPAPGQPGVVAPDVAPGGAAPEIMPAFPPAGIKPPQEPRTVTDVAHARHVDVLKLIDIQQDSRLGEWSVANNGLVGRATRGGQPLIEIPYAPPLEYDFEVKFIRTAGNDTLDMVCSEAGRQFSFTVAGWWNTVIAFGYIDGKEGRDNNSAATSKSWITNGQEYTSLVKVRKTGVEGYLNGQLVSSHKTDDFTEMTCYPWNALLDRHSLGLCIGPGTTTTIESAQVIEITGEGKNLR